MPPPTTPPKPQAAIGHHHAQRSAPAERVAAAREHQRDDREQAPALARERAGQDREDGREDRRRRGLAGGDAARMHRHDHRGERRRRPPQARPRGQRDERHQEAERYLTSDLRLCTETLGLVELLTGDSVVSDAFALDSLRPRLAGMLLSVMRAFTGRRSMDIKIEHPEKYGFDPKDILSRVGRIATHFAQTPNFAAALAESGYYQPDLLPKTAATLRRIRGLDDAEVRRPFHKLGPDVVVLRDRQRHEAAVEGAPHLAPEAHLP